MLSEIESQISIFRIGNEMLKNYLLKDIDEKERANYHNFDPNYKYSEKDIKNSNLIFENSYCKDNLVNEVECHAENLVVVENLVFPESVPILQFLSSITCIIDDNWKSNDNYTIKFTNGKFITNKDYIICNLYILKY